VGVSVTWRVRQAIAFPSVAAFPSLHPYIYLGWDMYMIVEDHYLWIVLK
jgi:hypothetical protein